MRWARCLWDEESISFYFEFDMDGYVVRQVELQDPRGRALAAASLAEWQAALREDRSGAYESVYGMTAEPAISEWEGHDPQWLSADEFETIWATARLQIRNRHRHSPS
ncbi:hypothetical protein ABZ733_15705 [Streptomyces longwoodensis]|uniref:hypothetical protein n=1 Tax=Streptomyces longwoodensis TaxID=68231 RepID=UPI0033F887F4